MQVGRKQNLDYYLFIYFRSIASCTDSGAHRSLLSELQYFLDSQHMTELTMRLPSDPVEQRSVLSMFSEPANERCVLIRDCLLVWFVLLLVVFWVGEMF